MDVLNTTTSLTPAPAASVDLAQPAPENAAPATAVQNWIAAGRKLVEDQLEPIDRVAAANPGLAHQFAVLRSSVVAGFHALLSHIAHEDHPGVIAEAAKLADDVVTDAAKGDLTEAVGDAVQDGEALAGAAASGQVVTSEDVASAEAAGSAAVETAVETEVDPSEATPSEGTDTSQASPQPSESSVESAAGSPTQGSEAPSSTDAGDEAAAG